MRKVTLIGLWLVSAAIVTNGLFGQEGTLSKKATPEEHKKWQNGGTFKGMVGGLAGNTISVIIPDPAYNQAYLKVMRLPPAARAEAMKTLANIPKGKEFEFDVSDKVMLRKAVIATGVEFDDKGNPKKYTAAEMAKLKDGKGPGVAAQPNDIAPNLPVTLTIVRNKKDATKPIVTVIYVDNSAVKPGN
jgi:hypothetical protein